MDCQRIVSQMLDSLASRRPALTTMVLAAWLAVAVSLALCLGTDAVGLENELSGVIRLGQRARGAVVVSLPFLPAE